MPVGGIGATSALSTFRLRGADAIRSRTNSASYAQIDVQDRELRLLLGETQRFRKAVGALREGFSALRTSRGARAEAQATSSTIALQTTPTAARLVSTEEINTVPTSYGPTNPSFAGSSSVTPTIGGTYSGSTDDTLTFKVTQGGTVGFLVPLKIEVRNTANELLDTVNIPSFASTSATYSLSTGLELTLSSGTLSTNDTFTVDVSASVGGSVNTGAAFNASGASGPAFDSGFSVGAGNFTINGTAISVAANDSVDSVIQKINGSAAGVSASFDALSETLQLTSNTLGSAGQIALGSDSSGFFSALKLTGAAVTPGQDDERTVAFGTLSPFASVTSGSFGLNATNIAYDPSVDSLQDLVDRINQQTTGITATLQGGNASTLSIRADGAGNPLEISDGGGGLLQALGLEAGTVEGVNRGGSLRGLDLRKVKAEIEEVNASFRELTAKRESTRARTELIGLRSGFSIGLTNLVTERGYTNRAPEGYDFGFGFTLNLAENEDLLSFDASAFEKAAGRGPQALRKFLTEGTEAKPGYFDLLDSPLAELEQRLARAIDPTGGLLDRLA
ncbi:MAG: flagellin hook IN motif-containing protein [Planctomycetota bacterium]